MQTFWQDARYAIRLLRQSPAFATTAILTLALAIGANAAIFSAVKGVLVSPLPYRDPDRLVRLFEEASTTPHFPVAPADFRDYRAALQTFDGLAAYLRSDLQVADGGGVEQLRGMQVTAGFFRLLGWQPALGREFEASDEIPGTDGVVLSHALWRRRFGGDPSVLGRAVRLSGRTYRVIGVLPDGFQHVGGSYRTYGHGEPVDVWSVLPVPRDDQPQDRFSHYFNVVGRVRADALPSRVEQDLRATSALVAERYPGGNSPWTISSVALKQEIVGGAASMLVVLSAAATLVLALACVNVGGLLLGRAAGRAREIGVRAALGATRARLTRQLLIESGVLAAAGGALGIALAYGAIAALARYGPADLPRVRMIVVDGEMLVWTAAVTIASALLFGLAPAVQLARAGVGDSLKQGGRSVAGSVHQRLRRPLAATQVALAFVLIVASGLLLRSFVAMITTNPGFIPDGAITASIELPLAMYDTPAAASFYARALDRVRSLPGVRSASFTSDLPWTGYDENTSFGIVGRQFPRNEGPEARYHFVTTGFAAATGVPLVAGRDLTASDVPGAPPVMLINESAAKKYWKSAAGAVGARVKLWGEERAIAGVLGDVRDQPWHDRAVPALYFPQPQMWYPQRMFLVARSSIEPMSLVDPIRRTIAAIDPEVPLATVRPLEAVAGAAIAARRLTLWLVATFGATALLLAIVGIYGVMAQAVGQRAHEFGVRQALGATRADILRLVLSSGAALTLAGLAGGIALSLASARVLASLLYAVKATDPGTFAAVTGLLLAAALGASYLPARRATRVSPASALRAND